MIPEHYVIDCEDIREIDEFMQTENARIYELDGREMTNPLDIDKVFKEKLGFEYESRNNMDAFLDSISNIELDFKNIKKIYIIIRNSYALLNSTHPNYRRAVLDTFEDAGKRWSEAIHLNEWWDRESIDFRVILAP